MVLRAFHLKAGKGSENDNQNVPGVEQKSGEVTIFREYSEKRRVRGYTIKVYKIT